MTYTALSWAYREEATSAKLQAMVDNITEHDHRGDGSQGADLRGEWVDAVGVVASEGWSLTTKRYRILLGGELVAYDFLATRTGADLVGSGDNSAGPGNYTDSEILTGIPAAARALGHLPVLASSTAFVSSTADGRLVVVSGVPLGRINTGNALAIRGVLWR